ncbi:uncharacterized protein LOC126838122 [Adelges cooleyi]|uniref:uncharacterized protein LOC126838122 n=1 Tax=Adelges cooleyi TaxID=133065 RepID=UPI00217FAF1A|nr:uncharacterized protein LOC126838122 [Adelges cooleyi]
MKSLRLCFTLVLCHLVVLNVKETTQDSDARGDDDVPKDISIYFRRPIYTDGSVTPKEVQTHLAYLPMSAKGRARVAVNFGSKRGNQFKNFMLAKDTYKEPDQIKKESYIPVKVNGKRGDETVFPERLGIYTDSSYMDPFQKWILSSPYYQ